MLDNNKILPLESITGYIWFNGQFIQWQDAKLHFLTHSLHYGGSIFEGEKAVNGKIFKLDEHTNRLFASAAHMKLNIGFSVAEIMAASYAVLRKNNLADAYIRPLVWRTSENLIASPPSSHTNIMIAAWPPRGKHKDATLNLTIGKWLRPAPTMIPVQCKSAAQYAMMTVAGIEAKEQGFDDALLLDHESYIAECTTSNIFFVRGNQLITPTIRNCLNGITRQSVIDIATRDAIEVIEQDINPKDIRLMDAGFTTGTANGIKRIGEINLGNQQIKLRDHQLISILEEQYKQLLSS